MIKNGRNSAFAEYLLKKHYSATTIGSYCRMLRALKIDDSLTESSQLYENINKRLKEYSVHAGDRSIAISKVVVNRYFEMKTGLLFSAFNVKRHELVILKEFYHYSVDFKKMTIEASKAECQHIRAFLNSLDENNLNNFSSITVTDLQKYITDHFQRLKPSTIGRYITSLRNFFRFLEFNGIKVDPAIFSLPMTSANWKSQNIPTSAPLSSRYFLRLSRNLASLRDIPYSVIPVFFASSTALSPNQ